MTLLTCLLLLGTLQPGPWDYLVYVSNERSGDVSVIDPSTHQVVATIPVGKRPRGINPSPNGKLVYVALSGSPISPPGEPEPTEPADKSADGIGVIDVASRKLVGKLPSGSDPEQFSLSKDGAKMYIANEDVGQVTVLDVATRKPIAVHTVGTEPEGVTTSPDGKWVYVTSETTNDVHVLDTASDKIVAQFKTAQRPRHVAFTPDSAKAYVTCETAGVVAVVDVAQHKVIKDIKHAGENVRPMGAVVSPDGSTVYVSTGRGKTILVIDTKTDEV